MTYKKQWSEFEVQALAYGILRKNLYPKYLVRGEYKFDRCRTDIAIFEAAEEPILRCVVEIKKNPYGEATAQGTRYEAELGVPCIYIRGGQEAYQVLEKVGAVLRDQAKPPPESI